MNPQKETSKGSGAAAQIAVYSASAIAGILSMWATIRDNFYRGIKNAPWIKTLRETRNDEYKGIEGLTGAEYAKANLKISTDYSKALTKKLEEKGFTNSWEKFKFLTKNQKVRVIGIAVTVAAVAVGAITNLRQNRQIARQLEEMNRKNDASASPGVNV